MRISNNNFSNPQKYTINPRQLVEGLYTEFNYKKRDGTSSPYKILCLDVYPTGGYVWGLKLDPMRVGDLVRLLRDVSPGLLKTFKTLANVATGQLDELIEELSDYIHKVPGGEVFKLPISESGKQTYQMVKKLRLEEHYRKFIMSEMKLVRVRDFAIETLL